jgi:hypothetical protein
MSFDCDRILEFIRPLFSSLGIFTPIKQRLARVLIFRYNVIWEHKKVRNIKGKEERATQHQVNLGERSGMLQV